MVVASATFNLCAYSCALPVQYSLLLWEALPAEEGHTPQQVLLGITKRSPLSKHFPSGD